ncbi:MAG: response regulator [Chloroflexi bacterium]|nr:response regulator [Chloroflexota bacterium]
MAKILIVDDDRETTNLLEKIVMMKGHQPASVNNSVKAVEQAHAVQPDIILMDILMPEINGIQLCKIFKAIPELKHIPIIIVSALNDAGSQRDTLNAGAADFLSKPVNPEVLAEKILNLVNAVP